MTITVNLDFGKREIENFQELEKTMAQSLFVGWSKRSTDTQKQCNCRIIDIYGQHIAPSCS